MTGGWVVRHSGVGRNPGGLPLIIEMLPFFFVNPGFPPPTGEPKHTMANMDALLGLSDPMEVKRFRARPDGGGCPGLFAVKYKRSSKGICHEVMIWKVPTSAGHYPWTPNRG